MSDAVSPSKPWKLLEESLKQWLLAVSSAARKGRPEEVLGLLEVLVTFMSSNEGSFLQSVMAGDALEQNLRAQGAPVSFVATFMDVIKIAGNLNGPRILSVGDVSMAPHLAAELILRFEQATRAASASPPASPSASPTRAPRMVPRPTRDMLEHLEQVTAGPVEARGALECITSLNVGRISNAVVVPIDSLPPAVIDGLAQAEAIPFLFFRRLSNVLIDVFFCIYHHEMTFIVKRKIVYLGPKPETQIEGQLMLGDKEPVMMLEGPCTLPWVEVAGLLEGPPAVHD